MALDNVLLINQLVFVGLNGYVAALHRDTGEIVWSNDQMHSGYVTMLLDGDRLIVSTNGYIYCLDPCTGKIHWHNPMTGYGAGAPTSLVSVRGQSDHAVIHEAGAQIQQRSAAAASTGIMAGS
jgi:outer membrane protein assembly factor BamB